MQPGATAGWMCANREALILVAMDSHRPAPFDPDAANDPARTMRWIPLVIPLAAAMILGLMAFIWLAVLT